jgi:iron-sulfur cluster repair protein YtfE (RIC family)
MAKDATASAEEADSNNGASPEAQLADDSGMANLDQVRDILFGADIRKYDQRLERLEEHLSQEIGILRQETKDSVGSLESSTRKDFDSLVEQLKSEQDDRGAALLEITNQIKRMENEHQAGLAKLNEQLSDSERNMRQHMLDQFKSLRDEMKQSQDQITNTLERETRELRDTKTDRAALGELLMEMAMRLNDELDPPEEAS